jgi:hypothetical protein
VHSFVYQDGERNSSRLFGPVVEVLGRGFHEEHEGREEGKAFGETGSLCGRGRRGRRIGRREENISGGQKVLLNGVGWAGI